MRYLIVILVGLLSLWAVAPTLADTGTGVSIPLTVTVTGGSSGGGGGGGFDSGGSFPNSTPDWTKIFPSMSQPQSSSDSRTVQQNPPIMIPPVAGNPPQYLTPVVAPVQEERDSSKDMYVYAAIGLGAILLGLIIYWCLPDQKVR
jgi:hypothetical protein